MRLAGRAQAAIDILTEILERHRPASEALKDWGKAHRFAGSTDRHAIGTLVYDSWRRRNSLGARMGDGRPRALVLAALHDCWNASVVDIAALAGEAHGPGALTDSETQTLARAIPDDLSVAVKGDVPEWLVPSFERAFGERAVEEGAAIASRAPIDLRVNTLKATRQQVLEALARFGAVEGPLSPQCVRIAAPGHDTRNANVEAETAHGLGWYELQDAASQVAALLSGAAPGETVADICAGAGGKTLAIGAGMRNTGRLYAFDTSGHRLDAPKPRLARSGLSHVHPAALDHARDDREQRLSDQLLRLPDQQDGHFALLDQRLQHLLDLLDDHRSEALGGFVHHQQTRIHQQRPRDRQHLLLAAGQLGALAAETLLQIGEQLEDLIEGHAAAADHRRQQQVFLHVEAGENAVGRGRSGQLLHFSPQRFDLRFGFLKSGDELFVLLRRLFELIA